MSTPEPERIAPHSITSRKPRYAFIIVLIILAAVGMTSIVIGALALPLRPVTVSMPVSHDMEMIAHFRGGPTQAVATRDHYAYLGTGSELTILDIANLERMEQLSAGSLPETITQIVLNGNFAYALAGNAICALDITTPHHLGQPSCYTSLQGPTGMVIYQQFIYVADSSRLLILDITNPLVPREAGIFHSASPASFYKLAIIGRYLYVAGGDLLILDLANPVRPVEVTRYVSHAAELYASHVADLDAAGNYVYLNLKRSCGEDCSAWMLEIVDVNNPFQPVSVGHFENIQSRHIRVVGNVGYSLGGWWYSGGLTFYDLSNPVAPTYLSSFGGSGDADLSVFGNLVFMVGPYGMLAVEASSPQLPYEVGGYRPMVNASAVAATPPGYVYVGSDNDLWTAAPNPIGYVSLPFAFQSITLSGTRAYLPTGQQGLLIVDVSTPLTPAMLSRWIGTANDVAVADPYAYVADYTGFKVLDVAQPLSPTQISGFTTNLTVIDIGADHSNVYLIQEGRTVNEVRVSNLDIIDVTNPFSPTQLGRYIPWNSPQAVTFVGRYAYVVDENLRVVDLSDSSLRTVGVYRDESNFGIHDVIGAGNYAYLLADRSLSVIDVSDPTRPTRIGFVTWLSSHRPGSKLALSDGYIYTTNTGALTVIDVSDPANPTEVGQYATTGIASDVVISGTYAYVAETYGGGLSIIDITDPTHLTPISKYSIPSTVFNCVDVQGQYAYLSTVGYLHVIDVSNPVSPSLVATLATFASKNDIVLAGQYAYLNNGYRLRVVNIANPFSPTMVSTYTLADSSEDNYLPKSVAVSGTQVLAVSDGVHLFDVSDPAHPVQLDATGRPNSLGKMVIADQRAYLAGSYAISIIDLSNPQTPSEAGEYAIGRGAWLNSIDIAVSGEQVYLATTFSPLADPPVDRPSVQVFNTWDPRHFIEIAAYDLPGGVHHIAAAGDKVYALNSGSGYYAFRQTATSATFTPDRSATLVYIDAHDLTTTLVVPSGAVVPTTTLVYRELAPWKVPNQLAFTGHDFDLLAYQNGISQTQFAFMQSVTLTIRYTASDARLITDTTQLKLYWWNGAAWIDAAQSCAPAQSYLHDPAANVISLPVCRAGRFALLGPSHSVMMPVLAR